MNEPYDIVRARFQMTARTALARAEATLAVHVGSPMALEPAGRRAELAFRDAWFPAAPDRGFDWLEIWRQLRAPDTLHMAVWARQMRGDDQLAALASLRVTGRAVEVAFLEGDPRPDCPLKGVRTAAVLEAAAHYAQLLGRRELRLTPVNERTRRLYVEGYGFAERLENGRKMGLRRDI